MIYYLERGHTYWFYAEYRDVDGVLGDPLETGEATAKVYLRDVLVETLTAVFVSTGIYKAKWEIPSTTTLEGHYVEWGWTTGDDLAGRQKFRVCHTGIDR